MKQFQLQNPYLRCLMRANFVAKVVPNNRLKPIISEKSFFLWQHTLELYATSLWRILGAFFEINHLLLKRANSQGFRKVKLFGTGRHSITELLIYRPFHHLSDEDLYGKVASLAKLFQNPSHKKKATRNTATPHKISLSSISFAKRKD